MFLFHTYFFIFNSISQYSIRAEQRLENIYFVLIIFRVIVYGVRVCICTYRNKFVDIFSFPFWHIDFYFRLFFAINRSKIETQSIRLNLPF